MSDRGPITEHLCDDTPKQMVSDRSDVSEDILAKHYDQQNEYERMQQRREWLLGRDT